jgi:hypothetical protein
VSGRVRWVVLGWTEKFLLGPDHPTPARPQKLPSQHPFKKILTQYYPLENPDNSIEQILSNLLGLTEHSFPLTSFCSVSRARSVRPIALRRRLTERCLPARSARSPGQYGQFSDLARSHAARSVALCVPALGESGALGLTGQIYVRVNKTLG